MCKSLVDVMYRAGCIELSRKLGQEIWQETQVHITSPYITLLTMENNIIVEQGQHCGNNQYIGTGCRHFLLEMMIIEIT